MVAVDKTQVFTLVLDREPNDAEYDRLIETGCDDAAFGMEHNLPVAEFDRSATSMADAIASAISDIESVGISVLRILSNDLVTLQDIAERVGRSRESLRRYTTGERGSGGFPPPVNPMREGTSFYRWSEVVGWLRGNLGLDLPDVDPEIIVADLLLQARCYRDQVDHMATLKKLLDV